MLVDGVGEKLLRLFDTVLERRRGEMHWPLAGSIV